MICKIVYNDSLVKFKDLVEEICQGLDVETYSEDYYKEKRKAIILKAGCGTKLLPFVAIYDGKNLIHAFYMEDKSCNLDNIRTWIKLNDRSLE